MASNDPVDWMDQPSAGLAIQGLLSHILVEDYSDIQQKLADIKSTSTRGDKNAEETEKADGDDESEKPRKVVAFYKLEMIRVQLITAQGDQVLHLNLLSIFACALFCYPSESCVFTHLEQTEVEVEDVRKAQPDVIAHGSAGIINRLQEAGDKLAEALRSLCWRYYGIQAEVHFDFRSPSFSVDFE